MKQKERQKLEDELGEINAALEVADIGVPRRVRLERKRTAIEAKLGVAGPQKTKAEPKPPQAEGVPPAEPPAETKKSST